MSRLRHWGPSGGLATLRRALVRQVRGNLRWPRPCPGPDGGSCLAIHISGTTGTEEYESVGRATGRLRQTKF
jgi:hypothetical protein